MNSKLFFAFLALALSFTSAKAEIKSGTCGTNVTWTLDTDTGLLKIEGTGAMKDYSSRTSIPWCNYTSRITMVEIADGVITIGKYAFDSCNHLASVIIGNSVTSIGTFAFGSCSSLNSMTIPNSVTSIGSFAFDECSGLTSVTIGNSVTNIEGCAFYKCSALISVIIPNSTTSIGGNAFEGCTSLTTLSIGNSITNIEGRAFFGVKLRTIKCKAESAPKLANATVFSPQTLAHAALYVPEGSWYGYAFDDYWYQFANIKEFVEEKEQVAGTKGYTLMDENYQFAVYDKLNDCIRMVEHYQVDEQNFNTSWTMQEIDGKTYLYNLGAEKYVVRCADGSLSLTTIPTAVEVENVVDGIRINDNTATWNFVKNENIYGVKSLEEDVTGIISVSEDNAKDAEIYNLSGQRVTRDAKGIVIQNGKKILVK